MKKKIVIIGGGIIGCLTAIYLKQNNHDVTIIEKGSNLGGILSDHKYQNQIYLKGTQYLDADTEWFKILINLVNDIKVFEYNYGSFTNFGNSKIESSDYALPVFDLKIDKKEYFKSTDKTVSLENRINLYPKKISASLKKFFLNGNINSNEISSICSGNLGVSRIGFRLNNQNLKMLKKENKSIDALFAIKRDEMYKNKLQYALPSNGYSEFFNKLEEKLKKLEIKIEKNSRIFPEWQNGKFEILLNKKKVENDHIFWSGNPTDLIKKFLKKDLDSFVFRTLQVNADILDNSPIKEKFFQVYSEYSKIFRINLYNIRNVPKIGIECFFDKYEMKEILDEAQKILSNFGIKINFQLKSINKNLISRFDIITIKDKQLIEEFLEKTKKTNLLFSPWTTYGRSEKLIKIKENLKYKNLIN